MTTYRQRLNAGVYKQGAAPVAAPLGQLEPDEIMEAELESDPLEGLQCPDCGRTFTSEHGLKIHRTKAHGAENGE